MRRGQRFATPTGLVTTNGDFRIAHHEAGTALDAKTPEPKLLEPLERLEGMSGSPPLDRTTQETLEFGYSKGVGWRRMGFKPSGGGR